MTPTTNIKAESTPKAQISRLLNFPPELRTAIFALVLVRPEPIELYDPFGTEGHLMHFKTANCSHWRQDRRGLCKPCDNALRRYFRQVIYQPALTRVCRQLRQETLPVFYGANIFLIHSFQRKLGLAVKAGDIAVLKYAKKWLMAMGTDGRKMLRKTFLVEDRTSDRLWLRGLEKEAKVKRVALGDEGSVKSKEQILNSELKQWKYRKLEFK